MHLQERDAQTTPASSIGLATDRRRAGRLRSVHPQLRDLLRGHVDPDAPMDPVISKPNRYALNPDFVSGGFIIATLFLLGAVLRFAV